MNVEELFSFGRAYPVLYNNNHKDYIIYFNKYVPFFSIFVLVKVEHRDLHPRILILNQERLYS